MIEIAQKVLYKLDPELAHHIALNSLKIAHKFGMPALSREIVNENITVMGIEFPNRVGLAAGLDKNGDFIDCLQALGFGFIEVGTVTPLPQPGNPKPRLFRIPELEAIINRMGFNNKGVDYLITNAKRSARKSVIGVNIGKNKSTSLANAFEDYSICLRKTYPIADYIVINISSPNTSGLRNLQTRTNLNSLLKHVQSERKHLEAEHNCSKPIVLKIAPDLKKNELFSILDLVGEHQINGVVATNTTTNRPDGNLASLSESGGLSGGPLTKISTRVIEMISERTQGSLPIIAAGGIMTDQDAFEKINAGASLIQLYSGLVYKGPKLISDCVNKLSQIKQ